MTGKGATTSVVNATPPYDARSVANLILDRAEICGAEPTNLGLQKLLYFAHGKYLLRTGQALVKGYFEAWEHGPVHPLVYETFRQNEGNPIKERARGIDYVRRAEFDLHTPADAVAVETVEQVVRLLGKLSGSRLRAISHARRGPWWETKRLFDEENKRGTKSVLGLRITDSITLERFRYLLVSVGSDETNGEPVDDTPLA